MADSRVDHSVLSSVSISEGHGSAGVAQQGWGPVLMLHYPPALARAGEYIHSTYSVYGSSQHWYEIAAPAPSPPQAGLSPSQNRGHSTTNAHLGEEGTGKASAGPEVDLWGSRSEGSHPHWLSPREEGLLDGFAAHQVSPHQDPTSSRPPPPGFLPGPPPPWPGSQPRSQLLSGALGFLRVSHSIKRSTLCTVQNLWKQLAIAL